MQLQGQKEKKLYANMFAKFSNKEVSFPDYNILYKLRFLCFFLLLWIFIDSENHNLNNQTCMCNMYIYI